MEWKECSISIMVVIYSKFLHTLENSAQGFYTNHSTLIDFFYQPPNRYDMLVIRDLSGSVAGRYTV